MERAMNETLGNHKGEKKISVNLVSPDVGCRFQCVSESTQRVPCTCPGERTPHGMLLPTKIMCHEDRQGFKCVCGSLSKVTYS